jgi:glucokinase
MKLETERYAIALDVGGTSLLSAIISSRGSILSGSLQRMPIDSKGASEEIIGNFIRILKAVFKVAEYDNLRIIGIGVGMPGPFDYENGISLIKGVDKFEAIFGVNLKQEFINRLNLRKDFPIRFENDTRTFLMGEVWEGEAKGYNRVIGLTLGTGLGSAFMINEHIVVEGQGVPRYGWIGGLSYNDGILDDIISKRGIIKRYKELAGNSTPLGLDVKEIASFAKQGNRISKQVFEEFGSILGKVLKSIIPKFRAECLVIGGQISRSFSLFEKSLNQQIKPIPCLKKVAKAHSVDLSALYGEAKLIFQG